MAERWPPVSLIVLNWNGRSLLPACLTALSQLDYPHFTITLVDNASSDDSVAFVRANFPQVVVLQNEENLGYAGGNNVALRRLEAPFAVLVNPDIVVSPDWLRKLIAPMLADETIGVAGCKLYYPHGRLLQHAGGFITHPRAIPDHFGSREVDQGQVDALRDVDYVIGAAMAVRGTMLAAIGLLDEGYFLYFEDADLCARARRHGFRVLYVPGATAVHDESAIAGQEGPRYLRRFHTSRWRYLLKHFPPAEIVGQTLPAEEAWLAGCGLEERLAADAAYEATLAAFPAILAAREGDGGDGLTAVAQAAIRDGLWRLRKTAVLALTDTGILDELAQRAVVRERPFASSTPLIGPLLARLRAAWAGVAVKWYVRPLTRQQNEFNQQLLQELRAGEARLREQVTIWLALDEDEIALQQMQAELRRELARMERLMASVEARLQRLEARVGE